MNECTKVPVIRTCHANKFHLISTMIFGLYISRKCTALPFPHFHQFYLISLPLNYFTDMMFLFKLFRFK